MTSTENIEQTDALSETVMRIIGGYRMGVQLNAQDLFTKTAPQAPLPDTALAPKKH